MKKNVTPGRLICLLMISSLLMFSKTGLSQPDTTKKMQQMHGHVLPQLAKMKPVGHMKKSDTLNLLIGLRPTHSDESLAMARAVSDPHNPLFRHYLTPEQFSNRFDPPDQDFQQVLNFIIKNKLVIVSRNRRIIHVRGSVGQIENLFHVNMNLYHHPTDARLFYATDREPSLQLKAPILFIEGLNNYKISKPLSAKNVVAEQKNIKPAGPGSGPDGQYNAHDIRAAYAPGVSLTGQGQSVGIIALEGYRLEDIKIYENMMGISPVPIVDIPLAGYNPIPMDDPKNPGTDLIAETPMDIEMAISMAPGLNSVVVYETNGDAMTDELLDRIANPQVGEPLVNQISTSYDFFYDPLVYNSFQQMAIQGQTFFVGSGDGGSNLNENGIMDNLPQPPEDYTWVTSVGGTELQTTGPGGTWLSETAWNRSGGGASPYFELPWWQNGMDVSLNMASTTMRNYPDVAMPAENVEVVYSRGKIITGRGTSASSPLWAGFTALVNQQAAMNGGAPVGFINPALYALGKTPQYTSCFHDITVGGNFRFKTFHTTPVTGPYVAVAGYDLVTGWGSPNGMNLINQLALTPFSTTIEIIQPIVNRPGPIVYDGIQASPKIQFQPGDSVRIVAGGCVQTGGSGLTWKRYVDPVGDNADRLYFASISLPGNTTGFERLINTGGGIDAAHFDVYTVGFPNRIPNLPPDQLFLQLMYADDQYDDNGYYNHDDGTSNQCRGVGDAYLKVTIFRKPQF